MIVVSNASPVINLAVIGQLDLLRQLYGQVLIPQAVQAEVVVTGQPGAFCSGAGQGVERVKVRGTSEMT